MEGMKWVTVGEKLHHLRKSAVVRSRKVKTLRVWWDMEKKVAVSENYSPSGEMSRVIQLYHCG